MRRLFGLCAAALVVVAFTLAPAAPSPAGAKKLHRIAIHVDDNDPGRMNMALNNAANITKYYKSKNEKAMIEIVAYGPGLHMLRADTSPVKVRIESMSMAMPDLRFSACGNTKRNMEKKGKVVLLSEAKLVPSGVVRLVELQETGWSYIRP